MIIYSSDIIHVYHRSITCISPIACVLNMRVFAIVRVCVCVGVLRNFFLKKSALFKKKNLSFSLFFFFILVKKGVNFNNSDHSLLISEELM